MIRVGTIGSLYGAKAWPHFSGLCQDLWQIGGSVLCDPINDLYTMYPWCNNDPYTRHPWSNSDLMTIGSKVQCSELRVLVQLEIMYMWPATSKHSMKSRVPVSSVSMVFRISCTCFLLNSRPLLSSNFSNSSRSMVYSDNGTAVYHHTSHIQQAYPIIIAVCVYKLLFSI